MTGLREKIVGAIDKYSDHPKRSEAMVDAVMAVLQEQEPVVWVTPDGEGWRMRFEPPVNDVPLGWMTLYAAPMPPIVPDGWEVELLDWVSACQSSYHIDNTPGHRFGGLGSNLDENRACVVEYVRGLLAAAPKPEE